ncbi:MAG: hypothetical protein OES78_12075 [Chromatiales bacterium]|nr:hypothetical protein [Chromatiales bacterium]
MIVGGGDIDLNTEKLNIEFNTKPRKGVGVSADMFITPFIKLGGTLASPKIGLSKKGVLLSGGAAVLTGGLSFCSRARRIALPPKAVCATRRSPQSAPTAPNANRTRKRHPNNNPLG